MKISSRFVCHLLVMAVILVTFPLWGQEPPLPESPLANAPPAPMESPFDPPASTAPTVSSPQPKPGETSATATFETLVPSAPSSQTGQTNPPVSSNPVPATVPSPSNRGPEAVLVGNARIILDEIMAIPVKGIPANLLQKAEGLAFFPQMVKGGFLLGVQHGDGVLVVKNEKGEWEYPRFVTLTSGSLGFQAGVQTADVILVFCSRRSVESALAERFTIGADASVSAGPVGRQTSAATDYQLTAEIYSYSRSRGLFLGAAIDGSVMENNGVGQYYENGVPTEAKELLDAILRYSRPESRP